MTIVQDPRHSSEDRRIPGLKPKTGGSSGLFLLVLSGALVLLAVVAVNGGFSGKNKHDNEDTTKPVQTSKRIGNILGSPPKALPEITETPSTHTSDVAVSDDIIQTGELTPPTYKTPLSPQNKELTPEERKMRGRLLISGNSSGSQSGTQNASATASTSISASAQNTEGTGRLKEQLDASTLHGAKAGLIPDRHMFITKGSFLECTLETAINSDVSGMTSCRLTQDVYSTSGKVVLLERGSRIVGQYQGGMQQGKARIFILWNRVETPQGVIVSIDSPGADALGRGGHSGHIDTHFMERFGGALLLSLVDDVGSYVSNKARDTRGDTITLDGTSDTLQEAASIALEHSINIPPTLMKNQGEPITVFVARDLDFRGVYALRRAN